jgi:hypothetical protein
MQRPRPAEVAYHVGRLLQGWRDVEVENHWAQGIGEIFQHYPPEVLAEVTDRHRGLPGRLSFFPSFAEIRRACDEALAPLKIAAARDLALLETRQIIDHRHENIRDGDCLAESPADRERAVARWQGEVRPTVAPAEPAKAAPDAPEEVLSRTSGMTPAQVLEALAAIPDRASSRW